MANTTLLKTKVEDHVRTWLASKFGKPFHSEPLPLLGAKGREGKPAKHGFDAVSEDRKILRGINRPRKARNRLEPISMKVP